MPRTFTLTPALLTAAMVAAIVAALYSRAASGSTSLDLASDFPGPSEVEGSRKEAQAGARERTLYVSVVDKNGEPVSGLDVNAFIVREDNARREVLRVSRAIETIHLALLVDNSTAARNDIHNLRDAVAKFARQMHKDNDLALVGLADRPTILTDYTRDLKRFEDGIGRLFAQPGSGMLLLDALVEVARGLEKRDGPRAAIVPVLTDGVEFSTLHHQLVLDALARSGAALHAVTIGTFSPSMSDPLRERESVLDRGPRASGGQRVTLLSSMALNDALSKLARELSNQYKVVYGRPESLIQPERITVSVERPGLTARGTPERKQGGREIERKNRISSRTPDPPVVLSEGRKSGA